MHAFLKNLKTSSSSPSGPSLKPQEDTQKKRLKPWVEKYRPSNIEQVVYQNEVVSLLKKCLTACQTGGCVLPNLLFYGPPGTGKTSTIIAVAKQMFGDLYSSRVLELNASDERGIDVIREKVKSFAQQTASSTKGVPPIKLIILDEADSMTSHAQAALRRTMEKESKTTRFCLICNYVSRIIDPIASRCSIFRFKPLNTSIVLNKLAEICDAEGVKINDSVLQELISLSDGDLRRAITLLQSASLVKDKEEEVTLSDIQEVAGYVPNHFIQSFISTCQSHSFEKLADFVDGLIAEGYSANQFLVQLHDWVVSNDHSLLDDNQRSIISEHLGLTDHRLLDGADEFLQLLDAASVVSQHISS